ncbi:MAG: response regulator transcription factor [Myxococcales bacterium]|nr:response regulator transcription factor [Myxococcales bacterium]MCB9708839.1 response regulator transcription factor [Myxococcales bacterium]
MNSSPRILVVEDDESILLGLRMSLEAEGFEVQHAADGEAGLEAVERGGFDLIILDVMLPKLNGYDLLARMRKHGLSVPVLMLSARTGDIDKVMGLDLGAEDYLTKPFSIAELLARIRVILRRQRPNVDQVHFGDIEINLATHNVLKNGNPVDLTSTEFEILIQLFRSKGRILSRQHLLEGIHGVNHHGTLRTIDNFIAQLRSKLEDDPAQPRHILTIRGVGYRLSVS